MTRARLAAIASFLTACSSAKDDPVPAAPPSPGSSARSGSADPWAPKPAVVAPEQWTVTVASHRGPCSANDPAPCHVVWSARADGSVEKTAQPNRGGDAVKTTVSLSPAERDELRALVHSPAFREGMRAGFPCQGPGKGRDATVTLDFGYPGGDLTPTRNIELCVYGSSAVDSVPAKVARLVRK